MDSTPVSNKATTTITSPPAPSIATSSHTLFGQSKATNGEESNEALLATLTSLPVAEGAVEKTVVEKKAPTPAGITPA